MAIGLKNSMDILPDLTPIMQFAVNEQCAAFGECNSYSAFLASGKPVFHIEYPPSVPNIQPADRAKGCQNNGMNGMSTVFKNMSLSGWVGYCDGSSATTVTKPGGGTNPWAPGKPKTTTTAKTTARPTTTKPPSTSRTSTTRTTSSVRTTSSIAPGGSNGCKSKHWDQCGGNDWKGCTVCEVSLVLLACFEISTDSCLFSHHTPVKACRRHITTSVYERMLLLSSLVICILGDQENLGMLELYTLKLRNLSSRPFFIHFRLPSPTFDHVGTSYSSPGWTLILIDPVLCEISERLLLQ